MAIKGRYRFLFFPLFPFPNHPAPAERRFSIKHGFCPHIEPPAEVIKRWLFSPILVDRKMGNHADEINLPGGKY